MSPSLQVTPALAALPSIGPSVARTLSAPFGAGFPMPTGDPPAKSLYGSTCAKFFLGLVDYSMIVLL
jgi:hypothetical protein